MAWEKQKIQLIEAAIDAETKNELVGNITIKAPPSRKYKERFDKKETKLPELTVGKKVVIRVNQTGKKGNEVKGYLLCQLLDWDSWEGYWNSSTAIISQVIQISHPSLKDLVGRLITGKYSLKSGGYWSWSRYEVCSFDKNFVKWL